MSFYQIKEWPFKNHVCTNFVLNKTLRDCGPRITRPNLASGGEQGLTDLNVWKYEESCKNQPIYKESSSEIFQRAISSSDLALDTLWNLYRSLNGINSSVAFHRSRDIEIYHAELLTNWPYDPCREVRKFSGDKSQMAERENFSMGVAPLRSISSIALEPLNRSFPSLAIPNPSVNSAQLSHRSCQIFHLFLWTSLVLSIEWLFMGD